MGVDYYNCDVCGEIFNDAGDYIFCIEEHWIGPCCMDEQLEKYGCHHYEDCDGTEECGCEDERQLAKCDACDEINEDDFIEFLCNKLCKTRQELEKEYDMNKCIDIS